ncbi:MAG: hypothetical protein C0176_05710 [Mesoaciditoga sp.]|uniref:hypothetical protein n=1 Tax=Athalassotoga sp. TaxID=2022597 RepID=UPI000CAE8AE5|nr:MAG: hypothetical protein C0185_01960 [Mesoaciditoga sp.]PMP79377.1 MAG: hypothetical protein C0176_05710 [Mesoaciditoga sp.]HEU24869.1 hypothetical protein [Mesoaciditoga lauensis]
MVPNLFLLIYTTSEYGFSNNSLIYRQNKSEIRKAILWVVLIGLALSFNLLIFPIGMTAILTYVVLTAILVFAKKRSDKISWYFEMEFLNLLIALIFTFIFGNFVANHNYIEPPFLNYLLGLVIASVVIADIFRRSNLIDVNSNDADGNFERILIFIFIMALQWWYLAITLMGMFIYRLIRYKKFDKMWLVSPAAGAGIAFLWLLFMNLGWI